MRKFTKVCFTFLISLIVVMQTAIFTVSAESFPCVGIVVGDTVNVRTGPGTDYDIVATVWYGVTLDVYAREGNWFQIGTGNGTAYISADYVSVRPEDIASRGDYSAGQRVVAMAKRYLGVPYVYGGSSPSGFDCSGFTSFVYRQLGYSINRTADAQLANGVAVSRNELRPGDLVMFKRPGNSTVHHVGIYVGDGMMIHAPQTGDVVKYTNINTGYYNSVYYAARRIVR